MRAQIWWQPTIRSGSLTRRPSFAQSWPTRRARSATAPSGTNADDTEYYCASLLSQLRLVLLDVAFLGIQQLDAKPVALLANDLERDATRYGGHDCAVVIGLRANGDAVVPAPANLHHVRGRSGHVFRGSGERVLLDHHTQLSERVAKAQASRHPVEATPVVITLLELKRLIVKLLRLTPITDYLIEDREVDQHFGAVSVLIVNGLVDGVSLVDPQRLRELGGPFTQAFKLLVLNLLELEFPQLEMRCQVRSEEHTSELQS